MAAIGDSCSPPSGVKVTDGSPSVCLGNASGEGACLGAMGGHREGHQGHPWRLCWPQ